MEENVYNIRTDAIQPNRRLWYEEGEIARFSSLIRSGGLNDPIRLFFDGERFRILDGEKRWRAARKLGLPSIQAVIADLT
jgi:ParB family chromosome partitioning protein